MYKETYFSSYTVSISNLICQFETCIILFSVIRNFRMHFMVKKNLYNSKFQYCDFFLYAVLSSILISRVVKYQLNRENYITCTYTYTQYTHKMKVVFPRLLLVNNCSQYLFEREE